MTTNSAPIRRAGERPGDFIVRLAEWLAEPQRRRLGEQSLIQVKVAVEQLESEAR